MKTGKLLSVTLLMSLALIFTSFTYGNGNKGDDKCNKSCGNHCNHKNERHNEKHRLAKNQNHYIKHHTCADNQAVFIYVLNADGLYDLISVNPSEIPTYASQGGLWYPTGCPLTGGKDACDYDWTDVEY